MRYAPTDKYTIAWFKLAECVARGEKEKAYGVYRLLAHSLSDKAYAYQLEGDLLRSFEDARSFEKYNHAAHLYYQDQRWLEVAGLCEHLKLLGALTQPQRTMMIEAHRKLGNVEYVAALLFDLAHEHLKLAQYELIQPLLEQAHVLVPASLFCTQAKHIIFTAIAANASPEPIKTWMRFLIDSLMREHTSELTLFMSEISALSQSYHRMAQAMMQSVS